MTIKMKKLTKNLILFSSLLILSQGAFCYTLTPAELNKILVNQELKSAKQKLAQYSNKIKVEISNYPNQNIVTNENICPKVEIISQDIKFQPNTFKRVLIKDSKNNLIKSFGISVKTRIYKDVLVANSIIPFDSELTQENTSLKEMEISKYLGKTVSNFEVGLISKTNFQKGNIITTNNLKEKSAILKNSTIDIIFLSDKGLSIKLQGKALKEGAVGDTILVRSDKYNKTYNAIVNSPTEVTVRI